MIEVNTLAREASDKVPNHEFWQWVEKRRVELGLSYDSMAEKAGRKKNAGSGIYRAIDQESELTLESADLIARAFGMTRLDVLRKARWIVIGPADLDGASVTTIELWEVARKLPINKQKDLIRMIKALHDEEP